MHQDPHLRQKRLLRDLRGAPLSIIFALIVAKRALSNQDLQKWTGYKDKKSIKEGLERLVEYGVVVNLGRYSGWMLTSNLNQLPLPFKQLGEGDFFPFDDSEQENLSTGKHDLSTGNDDLSTVEGDFSRFPLIKKVDLIYSDDLDEPTYLSSSKQSRAKKTSSGKYPEPDREPCDEILELCDELKIMPPASNWLAGWSWVTPEYLLAHVDKAEDEGQAIGLAIWRISQHHPQPKAIKCPTCRSKHHLLADGTCIACERGVRR